MHFKACIFILSFLFSFLSGAVVESVIPRPSSSIRPVSPTSYYLCRYKKETRSIYTMSSTANVCQTLYTKLGKDKVVGYGQHKKYCNGVAKKVVDNLQSGGWSCRSVFSLQIEVF